MNYSEIVAALNSASGFDLFRLSAAIDRMLEDPKHILAAKRVLRLGQEIEYFEPDENRAVRARIVKFGRTMVSVVNLDDGARWRIYYYYINLDNVDTAIVTSGEKQGLDKNEVSVGSQVGFLDRNNIERYGQVIRINQKTVTLDCDGQKWRVSYSYLFKVISPDVNTLPRDINTITTTPSS